MRVFKRRIGRSRRAADGRAQETRGDRVANNLRWRIAKTRPRENSPGGGRGQGGTVTLRLLAGHHSGSCQKMCLCSRWTFLKVK